jgi:hypothetical protein
MRLVFFSETGYAESMIFEQTVTIPVDRHLSLDLPETVPSGQATLVISYINAQKPSERFFAQLPSLDELKQQAAEKTAHRVTEGIKPFEGLCGCLKGSKTFAGDPVKIIRKIRDEW